MIESIDKEIIFGFEAFDVHVHSIVLNLKLSNLLIERTENNEKLFKLKKGRAFDHIIACSAFNLVKIAEKFNGQLLRKHEAQKKGRRRRSQIERKKNKYGASQNWRWQMKLKFVVSLSHWNDEVSWNDFLEVRKMSKSYPSKVRRQRRRRRPRVEDAVYLPTFPCASISIFIVHCRTCRVSFLLLFTNIWCESCALNRTHLLR